MTLLERAGDELYDLAAKALRDLDAKGLQETPAYKYLEQGIRTMRAAAKQAKDAEQRTGAA